MDRLLNISDPVGYPLCAETLELLHTNVQLLETVLNGLNLPLHTIVRFPYGDFAYVQSVSSSAGHGEILEIATGGNLANSEVNSYTITTEDHDIIDSYDVIYPSVYQTRRLNLYSTFPSQQQLVSVMNFGELLEKAQWKTLQLRTSNPYIDKNGGSVSSYVSGSVIKVKSNDKELRIRICLQVNNLPIGQDSEFRMIFVGDCLDDVGDVISLLSSFNETYINRSVSAALSTFGTGKFQIKIATHELYGQGDVTSFTGQITLNAVLFVEKDSGITYNPNQI